MGELYKMPLFFAPVFEGVGAQVHQYNPFITITHARTQKKTKKRETRKENCALLQVQILH